MTATRAPTDPPAVDALRRAVAKAATVEAALTAGVLDAYRNGSTQTVIGEVLGLRQPHLARKYAAEFASVPPDRSSRQPSGARVRQLEKIMAARTAAADRVFDAVLACRRADPPVIWAVIARILGVKQPNAVAKYKPLIDAATGHTPAPARPRPVRGKAS